MVRKKICVSEKEINLVQSLSFRTQHANKSNPVENTVIPGAAYLPLAPPREDRQLRGSPRVTSFTTTLEAVNICILLLDTGNMTKMVAALSQ